MRITSAAVNHLQSPAVTPQQQFGFVFVAFIFERLYVIIVPNHKKSFKNKRYKNETELSKYICKLKENHVENAASI